MRISELVSPHPYAPYHLINAALNIQGSDYANRRGRNADFFLFSPCYVGSEATGYRETLPVESAANIDLATAMAISGAAFSSNIGGEFDPAAHADARDLERPDGLLAQKPTLYRVFDGCSERFKARTGADDQMVFMVRDYWTTL